MKHHQNHHVSHDTKHVKVHASHMLQILWGQLPVMCCMTCLKNCQVHRKDIFHLKTDISFHDCIKITGLSKPREAFNLKIWVKRPCRFHVSQPSKMRTLKLNLDTQKGYSITWCFVGFLCNFETLYLIPCYVSVCSMWEVLGTNLCLQIVRRRSYLILESLKSTDQFRCLVAGKQFSG